MREVTFEALRDPKVRQQLGDVTFASTTDGNHGRGVAWMAHELGYRSVIYMPKGTTQTRLENIRKLGAEASITCLLYTSHLENSALPHDTPPHFARLNSDKNLRHIRWRAHHHSCPLNRGLYNPFPASP